MKRQSAARLVRWLPSKIRVCPQAEKPIRQNGRSMPSKWAKSEIDGSKIAFLFHDLTMEHIDLFLNAFEQTCILSFREQFFLP